MRDLPTLEDVHATDVPTVKHVPHGVRARFGRALRMALGRLEGEQSLAAVIEWEMLPKCLLCLPPSGRGGRQHRKQTERWVRARLER